MEPFSELEYLWAAAVPPPPASAAQIVREVKKRQRKMQLKTLLLTLLLLVSVGVQVWVILYFRPRYATTRIGLAIMIAVSSVAAVGNLRQLTLLRKATNAHSVTRALEKMLRYQLRMRRYARRQISVFFALLTIGLLLYLYEFAHHSTLFTVLSYGSTLLYTAFCWFWMRPRLYRKTKKTVGEMICHLESVQQDFSEEETS